MTGALATLSNRRNMAAGSLRRGHPQLHQPALDALRRLRFTGEVWAVPEERIVFAGEPLLEVTAPIAEAKLVQTVLANQVAFHTAVASKVARCRIAAAAADLVDFAFRRTQGANAARRWRAPRRS